MTAADELKSLIATADEVIDSKQKERERKVQQIEALDIDINSLRAQRARLQSMLTREEAPLVKPQPKSVKAGPIDI